MLKQDNKDLTVYGMNQKCPFCNKMLYYAITDTSFCFIYCSWCKLETKEYHQTKKEAAKDWMDVAIEKEKSIEETEESVKKYFQSTFIMHCEFEIK